MAVWTWVVMVEVRRRLGADFLVDGMWGVRYTEELRWTGCSLNNGKDAVAITGDGGCVGGTEMFARENV